jgi:hypothetical protein
MDTTAFAVPAYSTVSLVLVGLLVSTAVLAGIISFIYWVNSQIRKGNPGLMSRRSRRKTRAEPFPGPTASLSPLRRSKGRAQDSEESREQSIY